VQSSREVRREGAGGNRCSYSDIFLIVLTPPRKQLPKFAVTAVIANDKARHQNAPANSKENHITGVVFTQPGANIMKVYIPAQAEES
jgi:hypothetical protein